MGNEKFKTVLCYRGSRDGWMNKDFHRMSDSKGPTITLFKLKENGNCIGGFTSSSWQSPNDALFYNDCSAMLFNLTTHHYERSKNSPLSICCNKGWGPCFGDKELAAYEPFNVCN